MLTQIQMTEPQAALLAACPRPSASVSPIAAAWRSSVDSTFMSTRPSGSGIVAAEFPVPSTGEVSLFTRGARRGGERGNGGYGYAQAFARVSGTAMAAGNAIADLERTTSDKQQDKQHLTARRGPVTWRPPH